ncbi:MAG: agmatine deiminase family protein, partial [Anaerolineales bacterium]|nr:agmatine deiminase family protein [Anaerolineales bacterium]
MPAEWERHEGTWLQWPHDKTDHIHQLKLERVWLMMVEVLHAHEKVHLIVWDEEHRDHVASQLKYFGIGLDNIDFYIMPTDDFWARDNGPIFVVNQNGEPAITNWIFNGWGDRFAYKLDNQVPGIIGEEISVPVFSPSLVLEGGAVEVNGKGTFMATRTSIIDPNRNPGKDQEKIEQILSDYLGVKHFIWLTGARRGECEKWGDETDSHIDIIARFTDDRTVFYNWTDNISDPRYPMLLTHYQELQEARTESGKPLTLVPLPLPKDGVYRITPLEGRELSALTDAAYSNYLVANGVVLVPVFGNVNDDRAKKIIAEQFPDREVVGIDCVALNEDGGAIHCVTQQQPYVPDLHK